MTVRLFAILRDRAGVSTIPCDFPLGSTVALAVSSIGKSHPAIESLLSRVSYAVNQEFVGADVVLHDGDELALIRLSAEDPMDDWLDLLTMQLDVARAIGFVASPQAGGIDIFLGTTRAEANAQGHQLLSLDYEAYDAMARKQLRALADSARQQWPILRLALLHRLGQVQVGEASVLIAVSTPHRAEAFEACRWLIDQLKKDVTLWKKEIWANGEATWIHPAKP